MYRKIVVIERFPRIDPQAYTADLATQGRGSMASPLHQRLAYNMPLAFAKRVIRMAREAFRRSDLFGPAAPVMADASCRDARAKIAAQTPER